MYIALSEKRLVSLPFKPKSPKHSGTDDCWKEYSAPRKTAAGAPGMHNKPEELWK